MSHTIVHLSRHGEVHTPGRILYGTIPGYHLSSRGRSQAARVARSFEDHDVTYLGASPLQRAQETSEPFAEVTGLEVDGAGGRASQCRGHRRGGQPLRGVAHQGLAFPAVEPGPLAAHGQPARAELG